MSTDPNVPSPSGGQRPLAWVLGGILVLVLLGGGGYVLFRTSHDGGVKKNGDDKGGSKDGGIAEEKEEPEKKLIAASPEARQQYLADINQAQKLLAKRDPAPLRDILNKYHADPDHEDLRGFEWHYLSWLSEGDRLKSLADPVPPKPPIKPEQPNAAAVGFIKGAVSPNGKLLAVINEDTEKSKTFTLWDAATGKELRTFKGHEGQVTCLVFNQDGSKIASGSRDNTVKVWDIAGDKEPFTFRGHQNAPGALAFFPDGQRIASADDGGSRDERTNIAQIKVWELMDGKETVSFRVPDMFFGRMVASSDGKKLLLLTTASVFVHDAGSGAEIVRVTNYQNDAPPVAYSPDGTLLATSQLKLWDISKLAKEKPNRREKATGKLEMNGFPDYLAMSPDGKTLVVASDMGETELSLWDPATGKEKGNYERFTRKRRVEVGEKSVEIDAKNICSRFPGTVRAAAFTADGKGLVTVSSQLENAVQVKIWDLAKGKARVSKAFPSFINPFGEQMRSVFISPDERTLVMVFDILNVGGGYQTMKVCDLVTGEVRRVSLGKQPPPPAVTPAPGPLAALKDPRARPETWSLALTPDGQTLAMASADHLIRLRNLKGAERPALAGHKADVLALAWAPDGKLLASGAADGSVKLWDATAAREQASLDAHKGSVRSMAFSPNGKLLATAGADWTVRIWEYGKEDQTPKPVANLEGQTSDVWSVAFSPDGKTLAVAAGNWEAGEVQLWNTETWKEPAVLANPTGMHAVAFSPDGTLLAAGDQEGRVSLWETKGMKSWVVLQGEIGFRGGKENPPHGDTILSLVFSNNGAWAASASADGVVKVWNVKAKSSDVGYAWHQGEVRSLAFTADPSLQLVSAGKDGQVILTDLFKPGWAKWPWTRLQTGSLQTISRTLSPDGKQLATGDMDNTVLLWDMATGSLQRTLRGHRDPVVAVAYSPPGGLLAALTEPQMNFSSFTQDPVGRLWQLKLWEPATGKDRGSVEWEGAGIAPWAVAVSSNGRWAAVAASGLQDRIFERDPTFAHQLSLWEIAGKKRYKLPVQTAATALAFAPRAKLLASASTNGEVRLWDVASQKPGLVWKAHTGEIWSIAFSPDGKTLATAGKDRAIHLWQVATGKLLLSFSALPQEARNLTFHPDGTALTALIGDEVRTWQAAAKSEN